MTTQHKQKALLQNTTERALNYVSGINNRPAFPTDDALAQLDKLDFDLPDAPTSPEDVISLLDDYGSPATVATTGNRYFGFVIGGVVPAALAANWLAGTWDQVAGDWIISPVAARLEDVALRWLLEILGLPAECGVGFTTGATVANFTAMASARHALLKKAGWNVEADGLFGAPEIKVIVSEEVHASMKKALSMVGFGQNRVTRIPTDEHGRMIASEMPEMDEMTIVCIQAGNVNTGAIDPAREICEKANAAGAWVHVDGAFGLWAQASPDYKHLTDGIELADSWATDGHKWLNVPYDSGIVFVKDAEAIQAAMSISAAYLLQSDRRSPEKHVPELSRRARGIEIWAALYSMGREGVADLINRCCRHAQRFAEGLRDAGYDILNDVTLNQVLVSFGDEATNKAVMKAVQEDGTCWFGTTTWQGRSAARISVSSWATTEEDVETSLKAIIRVANQVISQQVISGE